MLTAIKWGRYENLRPAQIESIREQTPIAYLPWGALEWHSYHAPIGLDGIKANGLCEALAQETGGVVLPPVYVGTDTIKPYKGFHHTIDHSAETVTTLCREFLTQLADEGFKVIVLVTGHYGGGHVDAIQKAAEEFAATHPEIGLFGFIRRQKSAGNSRMCHSVGGHAFFAARDARSGSGAYDGFSGSVNN